MTYRGISVILINKASFHVILIEGIVPPPPIDSRHTIPQNEFIAIFAL